MKRFCARCQPFALRATLFAVSVVPFELVAHELCEHPEHGPKGPAVALPVKHGHDPDLPGHGSHGERRPKESAPHVGTGLAHVATFAEPERWLRREQRHVMGTGAYYAGSGTGTVFEPHSGAVARGFALPPLAMPPTVERAPWGDLPPPTGVNAAIGARVRFPG
jgi:hypothetical protein